MYTYIPQFFNEFIWLLIFLSFFFINSGMIKEAEDFAEQDKLVKERVDAKNSFESYIYSMRNTVEDPEKLANKLEEDDKQKIKDAISESQSWLESHIEATKEEFEEKQKELEQ